MGIISSQKKKKRLKVFLSRILPYKPLSLSREINCILVSFYNLTECSCYGCHIERVAQRQTSQSRHLLFQR